MGDDVLPAYLITGEDAVLVGEAARDLVRRLVGEEDVALVVEEHAPDGEAPDTAPIADAAATPPFLTERRVVIARDVGGYSSEGLAPLLVYLTDPLPSTSVVLVEGSRRAPKPLVEAVRRVGHVVSAGVPVNRKGRSAWLAKQLQGAPVRLAPGALDVLERHLGEDLGRLTNLLQALAAAYGSGARLGPDDLSPFLGEAGGVPPWELTDAVDRGDTPAALATLTRMLGAGERHPLVVMATLHTHYLRMLSLEGAAVEDEASAARALGLRGSTWPARKALDQSRRLGHDRLAEAFALLAQADVDLRGAKEWPEALVLEVLVARLARLRRTAPGS